MESCTKMAYCKHFVAFYNNLCISFGTCKVLRLNHSRSKIIPKSNFPAKLVGKNGSAIPWVFLIDSDAEVFIHLTQCIRFGLWKEFSSDAGILSAKTQEETLTQKKLSQSNSNWINSQIANICGRKEGKIILYTLDYFLAISILW